MTYTNWYQKDRKQDWCTPPSLFNPLHARFQFTLDGAAREDNALLPRYSSPDKPRSWVAERVFCNPPWSDIPPFVERAATADVAVLLVPARTNAKWFHRALALGAKAEFFLGRPRFVGAKSGSPVDCLLLVWEDSDLEDLL